MNQQKSMTISPTSWFLFSETNEPLGQIYRSGDEAIPAIGDRITNGAKWNSVEVVEFTELRASCGMRRFRVTARILDQELP